MTPRSGLGKGLDALLPISHNKLPAAFSTGGQMALPLDKIIANPNQPRKNFDPVALEELAETIRRNGVLQPILVEENDEGTYTIIAGERRTRAARIAGLSEIPAIVKKFSREESFLVSILENLQREDLNPIEEANAFKQLIELGGFNQDEAAVKVGKNRATVANALRLLKLPPIIQEALKTTAITAGHARALLSIDDRDSQIALFQQIALNKLSVREAEKRASELARGEATTERSAAAVTEKTVSERDIELVALEEQLIKILGTKVKIEGDFSGGALKIEYYSGDDLDRLYRMLIHA